MKGSNKVYHTPPLTAEEEQAGLGKTTEDEAADTVAPPAQDFGLPDIADEPKDMFATRKTHVEQADEAIAKQKKRLIDDDCCTDPHDPFPDGLDPMEKALKQFPDELGHEFTLGDTDPIPDKPDLPKFDNWAHRSQGMRCNSCMWFIEKSGTTVEVFGRCRKRAPTLSGFPAVYGSDWCGDHKMDEMKL